MRKTIQLCAALFGFSAIALSAHPALACGDDAPVLSRPSDQASNLFAEAARLETRANSLESRAASADRQAEENLVEARALRIEAATIEGLERSRVLAIAESMAAQAVTAHAQARQLRDQATQLHALARSDRERAVRLTGGGRPGWRGPVATTI